MFLELPSLQIRAQGPLRLFGLRSRGRGGHALTTVLKDQGLGRPATPAIIGRLGQALGPAPGLAQGNYRVLLSTLTLTTITNQAYLYLRYKGWGEGENFSWFRNRRMRCPPDGREALPGHTDERQPKKDVLGQMSCGHKTPLSEFQGSNFRLIFYWYRTCSMLK